MESKPRSYEHVDNLIRLVDVVLAEEEPALSGLLRYVKEHENEDLQTARIYEFPSLPFDGPDQAA
jgi:hypothetical protein